MKDLELKVFEAKDFMGINSENPIVIDFTKSKKNGVVKLTGDQGVCKTSTIMALMYLMGAAFNIDQKHLKNMKDEAIDLNLEFEYDGSSYKVEAGTTRMVLKKSIGDKFVNIGEPKATLKKIFGNLGVSPMFLKEMEGKKQIQWFKETFGADEDASKKEKKIVADIDTLFLQRRDVNRDIKTLKGSLEADPLYQNYEKSQERFKTTVSAEKEKAALDAATEQMREYERSKEGVASLTRQRAALTIEIDELRLKLEKAEAAQKETRKRIEDGEKWLEKNKGVPNKFSSANEAWLNLSKTIADQQAWKAVLKREKEYNEMVEVSIQADGQLDKLRLELLKITKKYLPDIEGLEIKIKTGIDDAAEGIFYNGKSLAQLSESELWQLFELIWEQKDVYFVFCENVNALGSEAVKTMNRLVKEKKAQIFATEMDRSKKEMNISFTTKLD